MARISRFAGSNPMGGGERRRGAIYSSNRAEQKAIGPVQRRLGPAKNSVYGPGSHGALNCPEERSRAMGPPVPPSSAGDARAMIRSTSLIRVGVG